MALFIYRHESGSDSFDRTLQEHYIGSEVSLSRSELTANTKKSAQAMMTGRIDRFLFYRDLQIMLPDNVNVDVWDIDFDDAEEVIQFLNESADVFADILLTR